MGVRQTVRDRITKTLLSDHIESMNHTLRVMEAAYRRGPAVMDERALIEALGEADSYLIDYVMRQRNYQLLSQVDDDYSEEDRRRAVKEAWHMYMRIADYWLQRKLNKFYFPFFSKGSTFELLVEPLLG